MFTNVGKKIQTLSVVFFVLAVIGVLIWGIMLIKLHALVGLLVIIGGILVSWIASVGIYGFGELIESSSETAANSRIILQKLSSNLGQNTAVSITSAPSAESSSGTWTCTFCGAKNSNSTAKFVCKSCKKPRF